jgi:hypothetical protein
VRRRQYRGEKRVKGFRARLMVALVAVVASGCAPRATAAPTAMLTVASRTSAPSPTAACTTWEAVRQVDALLAGRTFETHFLTINDVLTLSVWLVDPEIDPSATTATLAANNRKALDKALGVSFEIVEAVPCVRRVFENINPMIVDRRFQSWYYDFIPIRLFAGLKNPSPDELIVATDRTEAAAATRRRLAPEKVDPGVPTWAGNWPEVRVAMGELFDARQNNTAAYLLIVDRPLTPDPRIGNPSTYVLVEAQWDVHEVAETDDAAVLANLTRLAEPLARLMPQIDLFEVFVVDQTGQLVVYATVPGRLIRDRIFPLPQSQVLIHHVRRTVAP